VLVSPASAPVGDQAAETLLGVQVLRGWGLEVAYEPRARTGFLACSDAARLEWVQGALDDPTCSAVICTRGGYGTQRILDALDLDAVVRRRAAFVGFSDITPLHTLLNARGLVTFYGPSVPKLGSSRRSAERLRDALFGTGAVSLSSGETPIVTGSAVEGRVVGGNMAMLASSAGTASALSGADAIVFLEDVGEPPRKVDRSLTQLRRSGAFTGVRAFALGQFTGCDGPPEEPGVRDVLVERLGDLGVPVVGGFPVGHGDHQDTLPLGATGVLEPTTGELRIVRV
jgi:muramoyltetrapeptide carboxypeptidase